MGRLRLLKPQKQLPGKKLSNRCSDRWQNRDAKVPRPKYLQLPMDSLLPVAVIVGGVHVTTVLVMVVSANLGPEAPQRSLPSHLPPHRLLSSYSSTNITPIAHTFPIHPYNSIK
ncbi:hypothetical protein CC80DRAFT_144424 [Byssothecium circinans]|uniref:Uncharacterized protein n=1 Tax=Byssothecium circinans TaxID=147558 RepID=A0A6A5TM63_9PLEO|nr:hypothetical protein CC80DRAFT_144424 [Byssothecium circinans]